MKTYAPSSTNRLAVAKPMPVEPPVINAVLSCRSAMIMPFASYFRSRAAFFAADEDGHAWTFLGGHLLNGPTSRVMAVRTLTLEFVVAFLRLRRCERSRPSDQSTVRPLHSVVQ